MSLPTSGKRPGHQPKRSPEDSAATPLFDLQTSADHGQNSTAAQVRRRRAAAARCAPLEDGRRRDPLESPRGAEDRWTSSRTLHVENGPQRFTAWLYGGGLKGLCERANVPHLWDRQARTWKVPRSRVDDVIAYAEHCEGRFVTVEVFER